MVRSSVLHQVCKPLLVIWCDLWHHKVAVGQVLTCQRSSTSRPTLPLGCLQGTGGVGTPGRRIESQGVCFRLSRFRWVPRQPLWSLLLPTGELRLPRFRSSSSSRSVRKYFSLQTYSWESVCWESMCIFRINESADKKKRGYDVRIRSGFSVNLFYCTSNEIRYMFCVGTTQCVVLMPSMCVIRIVGATSNLHSCL